jgi:hypothetical protein
MCKCVCVSVCILKQTNGKKQRAAFPLPSNLQKNALQRSGAHRLPSASVFRGEKMRMCMCMCVKVYVYAYAYAYVKQKTRKNKHLPLHQTFKKECAAAVGCSPSRSKIEIGVSKSSSNAKSLPMLRKIDHFGCMDKLIARDVFLRMPKVGNAVFTQHTQYSHTTHNTRKHT